jgi:flagellar biosynthesis/type III secretory pathway protein FliH
MTNELSPLARQIMGHANVMPMFTQKEFDRALAEAKAEIMTIAIEATKQAIAIEREECARLAENCVDIEKLADQIRSRMLQPKPH